MNASSRRRKRATAQVVGAAATLAAVPALAAIAPLWATAAATRLLPRITGRKPEATLTSQEILQYSPEIGWKPRPHLDAYGGREDAVYHFTTDAEGWREARTALDESDIVVFGDSFAFGRGVDDQELYSSWTNGAVTKGVGADGYSMVHSALWMERLQARTAGSTVIWLVFLGNDLYDNLQPGYRGRYRTPFVRLRDNGWEIATQHVSEGPFPFPVEANSSRTEIARLCTPGFYSDRALDAAGYLVERAQAICASGGSPLHVLSVPHRSQIDRELLPRLKASSPEPDYFDPHLPDKRLAGLCAALGVPFVPLSEHLEPHDYFARDVHWRPSGHQKVGSLLAELHQAAAIRPSLQQ